MAFSRVDDLDLNDTIFTHGERLYLLSSLFAAEPRCATLPPHGLTDLQWPDFGLRKISKQFRQLIGRSSQRRKRTEVHGNHSWRSEQAARQCGLARAHGEKVADRQEPELGMIQLLDEL